ncbi:SDR family oxidoreductase [Alphaproteobacteria bacterium]|nr:SDR family oxidoreductase [Alphaproteobacteria bacterium]
MADASPVCLDGKRILVTGGARGLGAAFAEAVVKAGARVVIADILEDVGQEMVDKLCGVGHDASFCTLDLMAPVSIQDCADNAVDRLGGLDGLVNNGAIATGIGGKTMEYIEVDVWDQVMAVNARGTWLMSRACLSALRKSGNGKIVNLASDTALWGAPRLMHYVASKGAVVAMTRSMARELGDDGIAVNAIAPGLVLVEATEYVPEERKQLYIDGRAMKRAQTPDDVIGAALFLLSDAADFVTGQVLPVNGGFVLN